MDNRQFEIFWCCTIIIKYTVLYRIFFLPVISEKFKMSEVKDSDFNRIEKLDSVDGWNVWKFQVRVLLKASNSFSVVDGSFVKPVIGQFENAAEFNKALEEFTKSDNKAQKVIVQTIGKQPTLHIMNCDSAHAMWTKLESVYEQKSKTSIHMLQQQFFLSTKEPDDDIAVYISKMQSLAQKLKDLGETIPDSMIMTKILMTLPENLMHFQSAWESTAADQQTIENLTSRLMTEEARANMSQQSSSTFDAFVAKNNSKKFSHKKSSSQRQHSSSSKPGKCFICNEIGHYKRDCPSRKNQSSGTDENKQKTSGSDKSSDTNKKNSFVYKRGDALVVSNISNAVALSTISQRNDDWYFDTAASYHMSHNKEWFKNYKEFDEPDGVRIGDGKILPVVGYGNISILAYNGTEWKPRYMENVCYVPSLQVNLFSGISAMDKGLQLVADKNGCQLIRESETIVHGIRQDRMFKLQIKVSSSVGDTHCYLAASQRLSLKVWHERLGHQNVGYVKSFLRQMNISFDNVDNFFCEACVIGKQHRLPFPKSSNKSGKIGELVHTDVCGKMHEPSFGGSRYFLLFKDDFSHFRTVYFMKQKSEVPRLIEKYIARMKADTSCSVIVVRSDNGLEYVNKSVDLLIEKFGIRHQRTVPYTSEQNGCAERELRTIVEAARTLIHSKNLSINYWGEAVNTAVYVLNRTGRSPIKNKTSYELWFKKKPEVGHFRIFGTECYVHVPKEKRKKWNPKSKKGVFVGYCDDTKGYRVWLPDEKKIMIARDITFKEETSALVEESSSVVVPVIVSNQDSSAEENESDDSEDIEDIDTSTIDLTSDTSNESILSTHSDDPTWIPTDSDESDSTFQSLIAMNTSELFTMSIGSAFVTEYKEPSSLESALVSSDSDKWIEAMEEEYRCLEQNKTWELVELPANRKVIDNRWVYKLKLKPTGQVDRYRARLVVRGFTQQFGTDYDETFSPVVKLPSVRMVLAIAVAEHMKMEQFDVKTAFLHGELKEEIFMRQPKGFEDGTGRVCKLKKSLYGLKQASRCWNQKFSKFLEKFDFRTSTADNCVFISGPDKRKIILAIWVDDGLVVAHKIEDINRLINFMQKKFEIKAKPLEYFLGLEIKQLENGSIHVNQAAYATKVLAKFGMLNSNPVSTPADSSIQNFGLSDDVVTNFPYREAVGSLMYLAIATRPDISYAVGVVSRFLSNPKETHVNAVKRILKYLRGTIDYGIIFEKNHKQNILCYSDSDYASDPETRRSTSGNVFMLGTSAISWASQRQKCVALSSTEAEFVAASLAVKEMVWIDRLMVDIWSKCENPSMFVDNQSAIRLIKNMEFHKRTKHIDVMYNFIREKFRDDFFTLSYVDTNNQIADIFTKPLPRHKFQKFRSLMGICQC